MIVTIHEFGHFLFARKAGIFVEEFAIGMGPKIFSKKFSETEFSIRALPIGGFCKMYGEDERIEGDDRAYGSKSVLQRFMVILGGPLFNFVLAMIVGIIFFATLGGTMTTRVDDFADQSPAREAGIMVGDVITSYNDRAVYTFNELVIYINTDIEETAEVEVKREGEGKKTFYVKPYQDDSGRYYLGFMSRYQEFENVLQMLDAAAREVVYNFRIIVYSLGYMATNGVQGNEVSGPIGILTMIGDDVSDSTEVSVNAVWLTVMSWIILLSSNLGGVMNLLPIPALDGGGRIMFILFEAVRGKPIDQNKEGFIHFVGFVILMGLMVLLFYNDIMKLLVG